VINFERVAQVRLVTLSWRVDVKSLKNKMNNYSIIHYLSKIIGNNIKDNNNNNNNSKNNDDSHNDNINNSRQ